MSETPDINPEQPNPFAEQVIADISQTITAAMDARRVEPVVLEDGSQRRTLTQEGMFADNVQETVAPDGSRSYSKRSTYMRQDDRGTLTWKWQEGGKDMTIDTDSEMHGMSSKTTDTQSALAAHKSNINYFLGKLPEATKQRRGWKTVLGLGRSGLK